MSERRVELSHRLMRHAWQLAVARYPEENPRHGAYALGYEAGILEAVECFVPEEDWDSAAKALFPEPEVLQWTAAPLLGNRDRTVMKIEYTRRWWQFWKAIIPLGQVG